MRPPPVGGVLRDHRHSQAHRRTRPRCDRARRSLRGQLRDHRPGRDRGPRGHRGPREPEPGRRRCRDRLHHGVRLVHGRADLHRRRRGLRGRQRGLRLSRSRARAPATASRSSARARPTSPTPRARSRTKRPRPARTPASSTSSSRSPSTACRSSRRVNNTAVACLSFAGPLRAHRPGVHRLRQVERRRGPRPRSSAPTPRSRMPISSITGPGEESGTFDSFVELAIAKTAEARGQDANTRPDYTASSNDNAIIDGISGSDTSLGWVGFAFAEENKDKVKEIAGLQGRQRDLRRPDARDHRRRLATRCPAPSTSTSTRPRPPRTRPSPPTSTTTSPTGTIASVLETVPYVEPAGRRARRDPRRLGRRQVAPRSSSSRMGRRAWAPGPFVRLCSRSRPTDREEPDEPMAHATPAPPGGISLRGSARRRRRETIVRGLFLTASLVTIVISLFIVVACSCSRRSPSWRRSSCRPAVRDRVVPAAGDLRRRDDRDRHADRHGDRHADRHAGRPVLRDLPRPSTPRPASGAGSSPSSRSSRASRASCSASSPSRCSRRR